MEKVTELLHGHFHFKDPPDGAVDRAKVICKHCNVELSITGVLQSYDCTVPIKVCYMLLLNSLLDFAYKNAINRDLSQEIMRLTRLKNLIFAQPW